MTAPLTPPDCDLSDFPRMMLDVQKLFGSEFNAKASRQPLAWMVGCKLWYRAWHQIPAASLPDDDDQLCHLAELGFDVKSFKRVKAIALHGWIKCDDGLLYHPTVAEVALEAWVKKLLQRLSSASGNASRYKHDFDPSEINAHLFVASALLMRLNPKSKTAEKLRRKISAPPADGLPPGEDRDRKSSHRDPGALPSGSQEKEREKGIEIIAMPGGARARLDQVVHEVLPDGMLPPPAETANDDAPAKRSAGRKPQTIYLDLKDIEARLHEAAGEGIANRAVAPAIALLSPILNLLRDGDGPACDFDLDVLPVIRTIAGRIKPGTRPIQSWGYFAPAIITARDRRLAGAPSISETNREPDRSQSPGAGFSADPDSRRANTEARRRALAELAEEFDGAATG